MLEDIVVLFVMLALCEVILPLGQMADWFDSDDEDPRDFGYLDAFLSLLHYDFTEAVAKVAVYSLGFYFFHFGGDKGIVGPLIYAGVGAFNIFYMAKRKMEKHYRPR